MPGEHREGQGERAEGVPEPMPRTAESPRVGDLPAAIEAVGFDIETTGVDPSDIVTVACAWSPDGEAHCFHGEDFSPVASMLDRAKRIYTFNGIEFDLPRFAKHCGGRSMREWAAKAVDPLYMMKHTMGLGACVKLNSLLEENGFEPKSASGLQAIQFWQDGDRDALVSYCMDDARLTFLLCSADEIGWAKRWRIRMRAPRVMGFAVAQRQSSLP